MADISSHELETKLLPGEVYTKGPFQSPRYRTVLAAMYKPTLYILVYAPLASLLLSEVGTLKLS